MELKQVSKWKFQADNQLIVEFRRSKEGTKCAFLVYCQGVAQFHFTTESAFEAINKQSKGVLLNKWQRGLPMGDALWDWLSSFDDLLANAAAPNGMQAGIDDVSNLIPLPVVIDGLKAGV